METKFNFKSQVCTDKNQSERLLALGLKKETADMVWMLIYDDYFAYASPWHYHSRPQDIPAWSLYRLLRLASYDMEINIFLSRRCFKIFNHKPVRADSDGALYDGLIDYIEWLIKEGHFPKEYLVDLSGIDSHQDMVDAFGYAFKATKVKKEERK